MKPSYTYLILVPVMAIRFLKSGAWLIPISLFIVIPHVRCGKDTAKQEVNVTDVSVKSRSIVKNCRGEPPTCSLGEQPKCVPTRPGSTQTQWVCVSTGLYKFLGPCGFPNLGTLVCLTLRPDRCACVYPFKQPD